MVNQSLGVPGVIVEHQGSVASETASSTSDDVVHNPEVGESGTSIEVLDWELSDGEESKDDTALSSSGVAGEIEARLVNWSGNFVHLSLREPAVDLN